MISHDGRISADGERGGERERNDGKVPESSKISIEIKSGVLGNIQTHMVLPLPLPPPFKARPEIGSPMWNSR